MSNLIPFYEIFISERRITDGYADNKFQYSFSLFY